MVFTFNKISVLNEEVLGIMERAKNEIRNLKVKAYGPESNYYDGPHQYEPESMSKKDLLREIQKILPYEKIKKIAESEREMRRRMDYLLVETLIEKVMPFFVSPGTLIDYNFYVVGRDMSKIDSKEDPRGRKDRNNHLKVLPVEEWKDAWKEYVSLDEKVCREGVGGRMPEGTNCLLSTVHRFYAVKEYDRNRRKKGNNHNGFLNGNISDDSKFQVDCRMKSGSEFSYKLVTCMSGLEDKPGKPRESIVDLSGIRLIFNEDFEYKSVGFHQSFMNNYKGDCKGSLILQRLRSDVTIKEFLKNIKSTKLRNFCKEIITIEDRLDILSAEDVEQLERKYYTELLIPFSTITGSVDCFGKNVVNGLTYTLENFKKTHEKRDDFLYRGRAEDWRNEHWSFFEWSILELLKDLLDGQSSWYIGQITKSKLGKDLDLF